MTAQQTMFLSRRKRRLHAFAACCWLILATAARGATLTIAAFGDYGIRSPGEEQVAVMVKSWQPTAVLTTGDNNYPRGAAGTIDANIGRYYADLIGNYQGIHGPGAGNAPGSNRFFPSLGNHDWRTPDVQPYLDYFDLPGAGFTNTSGNERYYDFQIGNARFFAIDSDPNEPDGNRQDSRQADWLRRELDVSTATWNIVYFHHSPFSSSAVHGSEPGMQWPFKEWGADAVLTGHDHLYERIVWDGFPYFITGLGGANPYNFDAAICGSRARYNDDFGALRVTIDGDQAVFEFLTVDDGAEGLNGGRVVDRYTIDKNHPAVEPIPGDGNQDGRVDLADLNAIRNEFGGSGFGDTDNDCAVTLRDLNRVRNSFGGDGVGDANRDGVVDLADLNATRNGLGHGTAGDLNRDGVIDLLDLNLLRNHFGGAEAPASVPEPATLPLLATAAAALFAVRRRRCSGSAAAIDRPGSSAT